MFYQADASSDIAGLGGASGADILNEFDLSLLEPRLGGGAGGFQAPGLLLDGTWTPKDTDPSFCTDLLFSQDSPTSSDGLSPESFCLDYLPAATDAAYPMEGAPPAPRTAGLTTPRPGKVPVYMWPRQSDPEMEKKRQRALKAYNNRQKVSQREQAMQSQIACMARLIGQLQAEKKALESRLAEAEARLSLFGAGREPGY